MRKPGAAWRLGRAALWVAPLVFLGYILASTIRVGTDPYVGPSAAPDMLAGAVSFRSAAMSDRYVPRDTASSLLSEAAYDTDTGSDDVYSSRPPEEWQGMLVNITMAAACRTVSDCSLALSCVEGKCLACRESSDCLSGEICVLDHCLLEQHVSCAGVDDCVEGSLCVLSGYSDDVPRNNKEMVAECLRHGGQDEPPTAPDLVEELRPAAESRAFAPHRLLMELEDARSRQ